MFKTTLRPMALSCLESVGAAQGLAQQTANASSRRVWTFAAVAALLFTLVVALSGCGPGTGGTGVGPITSTSSVASPTFLYIGAITVASPVLLPASTAAEATPAAAPCTVNCSMAVVTLVINDEQAQLTSKCFGFASQNPFTFAASGSTVVAGSFQTLNTAAGQTIASSVVASLTLQFGNGQADSPHVTVSVRDSAGTLLLGPAILPRVAGAGSVSPTGIGTDGALSCP